MEKGYNQAEPLTMIKTSCHFSPLLIRQIQKNSSMFSFPCTSASMLRTLHSDTKINILNPNLYVKMFSKGVQTYLESNFSFPFVPNKKML